MTIDSHIDRLAIITAKTTEFLNSAQIEPTTIKEIQLIVEEIATNIIKYAYQKSLKNKHQIEITLKIENNCIVTIFRDWGHPFSPINDRTVTSAELSAEIEDREIGGLGILLVKELADKIEYTRHGRQNILKIEKFTNSNHQLKILEQL